LETAEGFQRALGTGLIATARLGTTTITSLRITTTGRCLTTASFGTTTVSVWGLTASLGAITISRIGTAAVSSLIHTARHGTISGDERMELHVLLLQ